MKMPSDWTAISNIDSQSFLLAPNATHSLPLDEKCCGEYLKCSEPWARLHVPIFYLLTMFSVWQGSFLKTSSTKPTYWYTYVLQECPSYCFSFTSFKKSGVSKTYMFMTRQFMMRWWQLVQNLLLRYTLDNCTWNISEEMCQVIFASKNMMTLFPWSVSDTFPWISFSVFINSRPVVSDK